MSTNSTITVKIDDNTRHSIYCHWDGYPSHNGIILAKYYNDYEKVKELVSNGDLSSLEKNINPTNETHSFQSPENSVCVYYGRDRGEKDVKTKVLTKTESIKKRQYNYYFDGNKWKVNNQLMKFDTQRDILIVFDSDGEPIEFINKYNL